jgi:hypothetical protein
MTAAVACHAAEPPAGFRWVNFKQEPTVVSSVEAALHEDDYSAIREIGIIGDFALVFTAKRDPAWNTPEGDRWQAYSLDLRHGTLKHLIAGYQLQIVTWLTFSKSGTGELALTYLDCYECEAATLFTSLRFDAPRGGWIARWKGKTANQLPGILFVSSDAGMPYDNDEVDQVWAVLQSASGQASVGTWYHSLNVKTGKVDDTVLKFVVDQTSGQEKTLTLTGQDARAWERTLCSSPDKIPGLSGGQDRRSCKVLLPNKAR